MPAARLGSVIFAIAFAHGAAARGQSAQPPQPPHAKSNPGTDELNGSRWFQLALPELAIPVRVDWRPAIVPTYQLENFSTYNWEAHLRTRLPVDLMWFNRAQPAIELNCLSTVCQPMLERTYGFEVRLSVGGTGVVPNNYLFIRREFVRDSLRRYHGFKIGIGGDLDL